MTGMSRQLPSTPLSVKELTRRAEDIEYDPSIPLKYWLRSADTLLKEARVYEREGNDQQAYLLYFRHAAIVLNKLSKHPNVKSLENRAAFQAAENTVDENISKLEILKPRITERYERYQKIMLERASRKASQQSALQIEHLDSKRTPRDLISPQGWICYHCGCSTNSYQYNDRCQTCGRPKDGYTTYYGDSPSSPFAAPALQEPNEIPISSGENVQALTPGQNRRIAVELAHGEERRRKRLQKDRSRTAQPNWNNKNNDNDLQRLMEETRSKVDGKGFPTNFSSPRESKDPNGNPRRTITPQENSNPYNYPLVPKPLPEYRYRVDLETKPVKISHEDSFAVHTKPPKEYFEDQPEPPRPPPKFLVTDDSPLRPDKTSISAPLDLMQQSSSGPDSSNYVFNSTAALENGTPLRTVFLPPQLRSTFLKYALSNTRANLETCGILCGTLISNALFISKLVIPEQESTSDTCETVNESALFDYCDHEDLMVLGWIHTHPTQTCFMSSRDLHTHCGYQVMMPESIAIVCAPSQSPSWGIFRLTDPPGMKSVLNCRQTGLFHPHAENNMYTDALRPGHVFEADGLHFNVVDLRP